jgi:RNA polymerase sigma-70 factor (ECF subfamily)
MDEDRTSPDRSRALSNIDRDSGFGRLVGPIIDELLRVARNQIESDDLAWEAVQDALLSLWLRDEMPPHPKAWLIRAVAYRCLHIRRTIRRRHKHEERACEIRRERCLDENPEHRVLMDELRHELASAFAALAQPHREVLTLHLIEGLDYESIARTLDVPLGTVRSRLSRAREALRAILRPSLENFS